MSNTEKLANLQEARAAIIDEIEYMGPMDRPGAMFFGRPVSVVLAELRQMLRCADEQIAKVC